LLAVIHGLWISHHDDAGHMAIHDRAHSCHAGCFMCKDKAAHTVLLLLLPLLRLGPLHVVSHPLLGRVTLQ
jgi:hypothetical protein